MLIFLAPDHARASEVTDAARRLLALRNIDEDKSTRRQLTEEQLKDLTGRLKEADARLPAALATNSAISFAGKYSVLALYKAPG